MESKISELNVDFIGGLGQPTEEESKALADFFVKQKIKQGNREIKRNQSATRNKTVKKSFSK